MTPSGIETDTFLLVAQRAGVTLSNAHITEASCSKVREIGGFVLELRPQISLSN